MKSIIDRLERRPKNCIWEITNACNLRCLHCEGSAGTRDRDELTTEEALALCDELADLGCERCNLSGGEPLLRKDWPLLARRLTERGVTVHLVTNGTYVTREILEQAHDVGVFGIAMSLDGLRETHDEIRPSHGGGGASSFDQVVAAMKLAEASPLKVGVITHINRWNFEDLDGMHEMLADHDVDVWQLQLAVPVGRLREIDRPYLLEPARLEDVYALLIRWMREDRVVIRVTDTIGYYTELEPVVRVREFEKATPYWTGCYAGCLVVGIESNGGVKGCPSMPPEFVTGNIRESSLTEIWRDEERFAYNTRWDEDKQTGFCRTCAYRRLCRCGCTTMAYTVTGTIYENPYCLHRVREMR